MIRDQKEYQEAVSRIAEYRTRLRETGLSDAEIKRVTDPIESFRLQFAEESESYEPSGT